MKNVYDAIVACRKTSGKLDKLAIISKLKNDKDAREFFRLTYEPRVNFYQSKVDTKRGEAMADGPWTFDAKLLRGIVERLAGRKLTGHAAKDWLATCWKSLDTKWERELLELLIARDVKAGFSEGTINKVWPDLVTDVPYMRCCLPKDAKLDKFPWARGVYSQIKADGMFANITHYEDGNISIESRNGSPFPLEPFAELVAEVERLIPVGHQIHGEFQVRQGDKVLPRQEGNGLLNTLLKGGEIPEDCVPFFEAWDCIPAKEARAKNKYHIEYSRRLSYLEKWLEDADTDILSVIPYKIVHSLKEAMEHYREALAAGLEGTIMKHPDMVWEDTTSKHQVKCKLECEIELKVVGYNEGRNKYTGMLGSLQCESADGKLKVNVAGFTDKQRKEIWRDRGLNVVTVKSNSIMPPTRKDDYSLFLPVFVEERLDKKKANTLDEILAIFENAVK